jgi:F-type H+-transporting ATPase subunit b
MAGETDTAAPPPATGATTAVPPKEPFPPFDPSHFASQLLWFAITFVALYIILARVAIPRIAGILATRRGKITGDLAAAERARADSEAAGTAYDKALAEARARAFAIADKARDAAKAAADAERARNEAELAKRLAAAEARIGEIKDRALAEVGAIAADAAGAVVSALASQSATPKEIEEAVGAEMTRRNAGGA